jgi:hypothetical protein
MERRERTRRLIELGGLLQKSGLPDLTSDDRAMIYGALLSLADLAKGPGGDHERALWRRRGRRAFEAEEAEKIYAENRGDLAGGGQP